MTCNISQTYSFVNFTPCLKRPILIDKLHIACYTTPHMKQLLPIILIILVLTGAITYALAKRSIPARPLNLFGISANQLDNTADNSDASKKSFFGLNQPTSSPTQAVLTPSLKATATPSVTLTPTNKITPLPTITEPVITSKGGENIASTEKKVTKITKTLVCTPVYGSANTCTEHIVVDTGAEDAIMFNFAGLSYLAGLASFIFAKRA